jgi:hypothetical protein
VCELRREDASRHGRRFSWLLMLTLESCLTFEVRRWWGCDTLKMQLEVRRPLPLQLRAASPPACIHNDVSNHLGPRAARLTGRFRVFFDLFSNTGL